MHHGVKGQKWGVRRWQNSDGSLTPEGYIHYYGKNKKEAGSYYSDEAQKDYNKRRSEYTKDASKAYFEERKNAPIDEKTGLGLITKKMSDEETIKRINPEYAQFLPGHTMNCFKCSTAYDMRKRGYDVAAGKSYSGYNLGEITRFYKGAKLEEDWHVDDAEDRLKAQGNGARGNLCAYFSYGGGHSVAYEVQNKQVYILDCQSGEKKPYADYFSAGKGKGLDTEFFTGIDYCRTDNLEPNIEQMKKEDIIRYGKKH